MRITCTTTTSPVTNFGLYTGNSIMRRMSILLLFLGGLGFAQHAIAQMDDALARPTEKLLTAHVEVVSQTYCHVDDESFVANLNLRLQLINSSGNPVILSRKIEPPPIVRAARDLQSGEKGDFVFAPEGHFAVAELPKGPSFGDAPDIKLFVLLAPGEKFEALVPAGVFGANDAANTKGNGLLAKGSYVLQVGVYTWPYEWPYFDVKTSSKELKQRWIKYGDLATGLVYSDFAPFTLPEHFKNPRCK
jgi:hypothetical protein